MSNFIPDGWKINTLDKVSRVIDSAHQTPKFSDSGYPMVRVGDIKSGKISLTNTVSVNRDIFDVFTKKYQPQYNDLLMTRVGSYGRSSIVKTHDIFCLGQNTVVINPTSISADYLYQVLQSQHVKDQIEDTVGGSSQKSLSLAAIKNLKVLTPIKLEQQKIAAILTSVDDVIEKTQAQIDKLKDLKTGMMQELLLPTENRGVGVDGKPHTEFKDSPVGRIPKGWDVVRMESISNVIDSLHQTPTFSDEGLPMVRVSDIKIGKINLDKTKKVSLEVFNQFVKKYKPRKDNLLMSRVGSYGVCSYIDRDIDLCIGQNTVIIVPNKIHFLFLYYPTFRTLL